TAWSCHFSPNRRIHYTAPPLMRNASALIRSRCRCPTMHFSRGVVFSAACFARTCVGSRPDDERKQQGMKQIRVTSMADNGPPPSAAGTLYPGKVMHQRLHPFGHRFSYSVFSLLVD